MFDFSIFADSQIWLGLAMLTFMEIVLGIDNIIFITIIANKLDKKDQKKARNIGLGLAMVMRLFLLLFIGYIQGMTKPFTEFHLFGAHVQPTGQGVILLLGGIFLIYKATSEIHEKLEGNKHNKNKNNDGSTAAMVKATLSSVVVQIMIINVVFSIDSILTAIGLTKHVEVMMLGVILSIGVMILFAGPVGDFVNKHPTMQMLGLAFLILIGVLLFIEGAHLIHLIHPEEVAQFFKDANGNMVAVPQELYMLDPETQKYIAIEHEKEVLPKGYVYFAIFFSIAVEMLNLKLRTHPTKDEGAVQLRGVLEEAANQNIVKDSNEA